MDRLFRTYNTASSAFISLRDRATTDLKTAPTINSGDFQISKDGGAFTNLATLPSELPANGGAVLLQLSATELQCKRAVIKGISSTTTKNWEDTVIIIETYGDPSSLHPNMGVAGTAIADAILDRALSAGTDSGGRTVRNALRPLVNKVVITAGTMSVKKEDDTTEAWSAALTQDGTAQPVTGIDPA